MSDPYVMRDQARRLEQMQVIERPGGITGHDTFFESGTFTPVFQGTGTAGTWAYSAQAGYYSRIGNRCFFNFYIQASSRSVAPTGNAQIINLPFTSAGSNNYSAVAIDNISGFTLTATCVQLTGRVDVSSSIITLVENNGTAPTVVAALLATGLGTVPGIVVSGHYLVV